MKYEQFITIANINNLKITILEEESKDLVGKYKRLSNNYKTVSLFIYSINI